MADSDDDLPVFVVILDYLYRKLRSESRVPKHVSQFSGRNRTMELLSGHDGRFVEVLRMNKGCFFSLCRLLTENGLQETRSISIEEQVMIFLTVVGHCDSNRRSSFEWRHSGETISRHFNNVCSKIVSFAPRLICPPNLEEIPEMISSNPNFFPYFQGCIGAMDGTHVPCVVAAKHQAAFRNRKGYSSQNVLAIVDFDMKFTYVVAGWEGSVHDARVLRDAQHDPAFRFPHPPMGKYYLVDSGYANRPGYLAPHRGTNYHLRDRRRMGGDRKKELFNYRHASLRNVVERTFGVWKNRFAILRGIPHYTVQKQRDIIIACAVLHNFIKMFAGEEEIFNTEEDQEEDDNNDQDVEPSNQHENDFGTIMGHFRDHITELIWNSRPQN